MIKTAVKQLVIRRVTAYVVLTCTDQEFNSFKHKGYKKDGEQSQCVDLCALSTCRTFFPMQELTLSKNQENSY